MVDITVLLNIKEEPSKEKVKEDFNWYDTIRQKMLVFKGGKLTFRYKEDEFLVKMGASERQRRGIKSTYRMLPEVEELEVDNHFDMIRTTNKEEIESWFYSSNYTNDVDINDITDSSIIFKVPDKEKEEFCQDLEDQGFRYE